MRWKKTMEARWIALFLEKRTNKRSNRFAALIFFLFS